MPQQTFKVTEEIIKESSEFMRRYHESSTYSIYYDGISGNCAVSRAIRTKYPKAVTAINHVIFDQGNRSQKGINKLPEEVNAAINKFDSEYMKSNFHVEPFEFTIDVPDEIYIP